MVAQPSFKRCCKVVLLALTLLASSDLYANKRGQGKTKRTMNANQGARKSKLSVETEVSRDRRSIDFNKAIDIDGQRRNPLGALLDQKQADKNYEFIKMRLRWHKEMIESAYDLAL